MIIGDYRYSKISGDYNGDIIWLMIGDYTTQYIGDYNLVGGLEHDFIFHFIYGMSSFPLTHIFQRD
jgi:hypothetical protein